MHKTVVVIPRSPVLSVNKFVIFFIISQHPKIIPKMRFYRPLALHMGQ